jgi:hypothetical protein
MFEFKLTLISKSEVLFGVMVDTGEVEVKKNTWLPFTRLRLGLIFITLDLTHISKP